MPLVGSLGDRVQRPAHLFREIPIHKHMFELLRQHKRNADMDSRPTCVQYQTNMERVTFLLFSGCCD